MGNIQTFFIIILQAEPAIKRLQPFTNQTVLQKTGFIRTLDRGATCELEVINVYVYKFLNKLNMK